MESLSNTAESRASVSLARIQVGETVVILDVQIEGSLREYVMRFGFVPGATISVFRKVPLSGMRVYQVGQSQIALRPETAQGILVTRDQI